MEIRLGSRHGLELGFREPKCPQKRPKSGIRSIFFSSIDILIDPEPKFSDQEKNDLFHMYLRVQRRSKV